MATLLEDLRALAAFEQRARRRRSCHNVDGTAKIAYRTKRAAKRRRLKHQNVYWCMRHGWHIGSRKRGGHAPSTTAALRESGGVMIGAAS